MKSPLLPLLFLSAVSLQAQPSATPAPTAAPTPATSTVTVPPSAPPSAIADKPAVPAALVYPTNATTIVTAKAGILNLCAEDIPRYTQTGPLPTPAPTRPAVIPPVPHDPSLPTIWTIGDSTVRTGYNGTGDDTVGQWGWGCPFVGYFDAKKVNVVNRAVGGTTSGSFYFGPWKVMVDLVKKGDVVILQFGTNAGGVELKGIGDETSAGTGRGGATTNYTFGWYLRQFIAETRAKGATPVICSLIPRNSRDPATGKYARAATTQAGWAKDVAAAEGAGFIDLNELVARKYDTMDKPTVDALFAGGPHTSWTGAVINAETVISGLKALKVDPVGAYYVAQVKLIAPAPDLSKPASEPVKTSATSAPPATSSATIPVK